MTAGRPETVSEEPAAASPEADRDTSPPIRTGLAGVGAAIGERVPALAVPAFRRFIAGAFVGSSGTFLQSTALGWLVLSLTNSPAALGVISALTLAPILLLSVVAGVAADRRDKRRMLVGTQLVACSSALILAVLATTGVIEFWHIAVLTVISGSAMAIQTPAYQAIVSSLVEREALGSAVALNSAQYNLSRILGPSLAGAIIGAGGLFLAFWGNALALAAVARIYAGLPQAPAQVLARTQASLWTNLMDGVRFVGSRRDLAALVLLTGLPALSVLNYLMLLPVYARDVLAIGAPGLGMLSAAIGVGALVAAFCLAAFRPSGASGMFAILSLASMGAADGVYAVSRSLPLSLAALAVMGCAQVLYYATTNTLIQQLVPARLRGRVMSLYILVSTGLMPVGNLVGGTVAEHASPTFTLVAASVVTMTGALLTAALVPELRRLGRDEPVSPTAG